MQISKDLMTISWSYINIRVIKMNMSIRVFSSLETTAIILLFIFLASDQSRTIPTQGETHQSVIPSLSVIHKKLRHTDGRQTNRKTGSTSKLKAGGGKQPRDLKRLICFTAARQEGNWKNSPRTQAAVIKSAHKHAEKIRSVRSLR